MIFPWGQRSKPYREQPSLPAGTNCCSLHYGYGPISLPPDVSLSSPGYGIIKGLRKKMYIGFQCTALWSIIRILPCVPTTQSHISFHHRTSDPRSPILPPPHPFPLVTATLSSVSVGVVCSCVALSFMPRGRVKSYGSWLLCLAYFAEHEILKIHPCCHKRWHLISSYGSFLGSLLRAVRHADTFSVLSVDETIFIFHIEPCYRFPKLCGDDLLVPSGRCHHCPWCWAWLRVGETGGHWVLASQLMAGGGGGSGAVAPPGMWWWLGWQQWWAARGPQGSNLHSCYQLNSVLNFWRNLYTGSHSGCNSLLSYQQWTRAPLSPQIRSGQFLKVMPRPRFSWYLEKPE